VSNSERDVASGHAPRPACRLSAIAAGPARLARRLSAIAAPAQPPQLGRGRLTTWRASSARRKDGSEDRPRAPRPQAEPSAKDRSPGFGFALAIVLSTIVWLMFLAGLATLLVRALMPSPAEAAAGAPSPRSLAPDWYSSLKPLCQEFGGEPISVPTFVWNGRATISPSCTVTVVAAVGYVR
jgi:hypothetical protein